VFINIILYCIINIIQNGVHKYNIAYLEKVVHKKYAPNLENIKISEIKSSFLEMMKK